VEPYNHRFENGGHTTAPCLRQLANAFGQFFGGEPWIVVPPTIARVSVTRQNSRIVRLLGSAALNEERSAPADA